jgi:hypothetical protein
MPEPTDEEIWTRAREVFERGGSTEVWEKAAWPHIPGADTRQSNALSEDDKWEYFAKAKAVLIDE